MLPIHRILILSASLFFMTSLSAETDLTAEEKAGHSVPVTKQNNLPAPLPDSPSLSDENRYGVVLYRGNGVLNNFAEIISLDRLEYANARVYVVGLNYKLITTAIRSLTFEVEGQVGKHEGVQKHWEGNILLIARVAFWENTLPTSFAFGNGLSWASEKPVFEEEEKGQETNQLLNFFIVEMDMGLPQIPGNPKGLFRIHHRSGIYGTYCPPTCGSNFISYGFKFSL